MSGDVALATRSLRGRAARRDVRGPSAGLLRPHTAALYLQALTPAALPAESTLLHT